MPRVTQYIRDDDLEKWNALPNKSEFIHNALKTTVKVNSPPMITVDEINKRFDKELAEAAAPKDLGKAYARGHKAYNESIKLCKHGADPKMCRFVKSGKPCK